MVQRRWVKGLFIVPTIPAIAPASRRTDSVYGATGLRFHELPLTPERVNMALRSKASNDDPDEYGQASAF
jgi:hypothetical protein